MKANRDIVAGGLREWRRRLGLTQEKAAATLGIPLGTLRKWEQQACECAHPQMLALAMAWIEASAKPPDMQPRA